MLNLTEILEKDLWPPKDYPPAYIEGFEHWYSDGNLKRIDKVLNELRNKGNIDQVLDIGFGNPIVLKRELLKFNNCSGLYFDLNNVINDKKLPQSIIHKGICYNTKFESSKYNLISAYALLHIIPDMIEFFKEAYRLLDKGGYLYTDGDKNIILTNIIRKVKMTLYKLTGNTEKYLYWKNILDVKESYHFEGINAYLIEKQLIKIGYSDVRITYWFTNKPSYSSNFIIVSILRIMKLIGLSFLFTHVQIVAKK